MEAYRAVQREYFDAYRAHIPVLMDTKTVRTYNDRQAGR